MLKIIEVSEDGKKMGLEIVLGEKTYFISFAQHIWSGIRLGVFPSNHSKPLKWTRKEIYKKEKI